MKAEVAKTKESELALARDRQNTTKLQEYLVESVVTAKAKENEDLNQRLVVSEKKVVDA